jgi:diguanylate cyclase (GGDEF)-like protein
VTSPVSRLGALRRLPRDAETFYAISDMDTARRIGGVLCIFGAIVIAVLLGVWPPTGRIGGGGWAVGAGVVAVCLLSGLLLLRAPERVSPNALFSMSFAAVALLVLLVWIGGEPYSELFLLPVLYGSAVHPPRRVMAVLAAVTAGLAAPLVYDGWNSMLAAESVSKLLLWFTLGFISMLFAATVRMQRVDLLAEEQEASSLARRDPLTGLGNRRAFDEAVKHLLAGARRSDRPFTLVLADIEGFKSVNDTHGHLEGDRCLRKVAGVLAGAVRPSDQCFRWGGDEFAILLLSTEAVEADAVIERIAQGVAEDVVLPGAAPMRLRFGVAEVTDDMSGEDLVAAADLALMSARVAS